MKRTITLTPSAIRHLNELKRLTGVPVDAARLSKALEQGLMHAVVSTRVAGRDALVAHVTDADEVNTFVLD